MKLPSLLLLAIFACNTIAPAYAQEQVTPASDEPTQAEIDEALLKLPPEERAKAEALLEASKKCTGDNCTVGTLMVDARTIYDKKVEAAKAAEPKKPDESKKIKVASISASAGGVAQTTTGLSGTAGGSIAFEKSGKTLEVKANGAVGSTGGQGVLPAGSVAITLKGDAEGSKLDLAEKIDPANMAKLKRTWILGLGLDRNLMLDRAWRATATGGVEFLRGDKYNGHSASLTPFVEAGVGQSGVKILPFANVGAEAAGAFCPFVSKNQKNEFCLVGGLRLAGGPLLPQVNLDVNAGAVWRHKIADSKDTKKLIHAVDIGATGGAAMQIDLDGSHSGGYGGLGITIR